MAALPLNAPAGFEYVQRLTAWKLAGDELLVSGDLSSDGEAEIRITCEGEGIWRVRFTPGREPLPDLPMLARQPALQPLSVAETPERLLAGCAGFTLAIDRDPWCLSLLDAHGRTICRENPYDMDGLNRPFILPLGFVRDSAGMIFLRSSLGYGLFLHTGRRCSFDLGTASCETYTLTVDGPYLDLYLIASAAPAEILTKFTSLTGRAPVPPKWSFGLWLSGCSVYRDEEAIRRLAEGVDQHDLPCDVIHIDPWWMRWRKYADFRWDEATFSDPEKLIYDLHSRGLRLSVWQHPYISVESELYDEGLQNGYYARAPGVDFWNGEGRLGPAIITVDPPLERLPLFVRAGAVIPRMQPANRIPAGKISPLTLDIYPSERIHYRFYEAEGVTVFTGGLQNESKTFRLNWEGQVEREFLLRVHPGWQPAKVRLSAGSQVVPAGWELIPEGQLQVRVPACQAAGIEIEV